MDKAALVSVDLENGSKILQILDDAGLRVKVALWAVLPEYEDWRLVLSSRKFDEVDLRAAYGLLHKALDGAGFPLELTPTVVIMKANDPFIRALRKAYGKPKSIEGMRLGGRSIGDRFIEDADTYRVS
jgi:hypothetical protein